MLDCYRNFRDDELEAPSDDRTLVVQIDLMLSPADALPSEGDDVATYPLNPNEVPSPLSVDISEWSPFATSVADVSNKLLHHRSKELTFLYFGVLILFLVLLTLTRVCVESYLLEAVLIGLCLASILGFVLVFSHLPSWHDESLDDKILHISGRRPLNGYTMDYVRYNRPEGGVARIIRIFAAKGSYHRPVLEAV